MVKMDEFCIGVVDHADIDGHMQLFSDIGDMAFEAAGVGYRGIDPEDCLADLVLLECLQDAGDGRVSGFDDGIGAGKAAEITIAPIFSFQDQTAGQGSLHEDDGVEGIDMDGAAGVKRVQLFCVACV